MQSIIECTPGKLLKTFYKKAIQAYLKQSAVAYFIMSNDHECVISTDIRPESCNLSDYYVFPENLAWTMAFTHEEGWMGPYFAKHPDYEQLNKENLKKIEKVKQIDLAKRKGWM